MGSEAEMGQRVEDLRAKPQEQWALSNETLDEIARIQDLPVEERRAAAADLVSSLTDGRGNEAAEGRNLRLHTRIERGGEGITIIDDDGQERTIWYK